MADDLADRVHDAMAEIAADNALSGFTVHRSSEDGTAAVTFRPGALDAYTCVLRWTLPAWADKLRARGFTVQVETSEDRGEPDIPQLLKVTDWRLAPGTPLNMCGIDGKIYAWLWRAEITTLGALAARSRTELLALERIGPKTVTAIEGFLAGYGYQLAAGPADEAAA